MCRGVVIVMDTAIEASQYVASERILSSEDYKGLRNFFISLFLYCCKLLKESGAEEATGFYVVFITRRCHVLLEIFWRAVSHYFSRENEKRPDCLKGIELSRWKEIYTNYFITDTSLVAMSENLAEHYLFSRNYPKLIIVDELMIHGRAMNGLLYGIEKTIRAKCKQENLSDDRVESAIASFREALDIKICMKNEQSSLLLKRYAEHQDPSVVVRPPSVWREFSWQCTKLVASSLVNNVAFSWGLWSDSAIQEPSLNTIESSDFRKITTNITINITKAPQHNYIWLYPDSQRPKAICTVRTKSIREDDGKGRQLAVPFIIFNHLDFSALLRLHQKILSDISKEKIAGYEVVIDFLSHYDSQIETNRDIAEEIYYRWISETNELVLNALLMKKFQEEIFAAKYSVFYDQLVRNYIYFSSKQKGEAVAATVKEALKSIWEWGQANSSEGLLHKYLDILLEDVSSLGVEDIFNDTTKKLVDWNDEKQRQYVTYAVEDAIAEVGYAAERNAYVHYSNSFDYEDNDLTKWGDRHSIVALLTICHKKIDAYLNGLELRTDLYQVISVIIHAMDCGLLGMNMTRGYHSFENGLKSVQGKAEMYTEQRAGEAALFILPDRYKNFLPVLADIRSWRGSDPINAYMEIQYFINKLQRMIRKGKAEVRSSPEVENEPQAILIKNLAWLFHMINWSGQQYEDWDFLLQEDNSGKDGSSGNVTLGERYLKIYRD